jgi:hypothetical protein
MASSRPCRHCKHPRPIHARGLCEKCYRTPSILKLYPIIRDGHTQLEAYANSNIAPTEADTPTKALPGSPEKIKVMEDRFVAGQKIFHPGDFYER